MLLLGSGGVNAAHISDGAAGLRSVHGKRGQTSPVASQSIALMTTPEHRSPGLSSDLQRDLQPTTCNGRSVKDGRSPHQRRSHPARNPRPAGHMVVVKILELG